MFEQEFYLNQSSKHRCIPLPKNSNCLLKDNYLSEFETEEEKAEARFNLGITAIVEYLENLISKKGYFFLPWLEMDEDSNLIAYWAEDGTIRDMEMDQNGFVSITIVDEEFQSDLGDGWTEDSFYDKKVTVDSDLVNVRCPVVLRDGEKYVVLYENIDNSQSFVLNISSEYKNSSLITLGAHECIRITYLKSGDQIYVKIL